MSRTRSVLLGLGIVALLATLFFAAFEFVEEDVERPFGREARRNPLLAAERLSERLGVPARTVVRFDVAPAEGEVVVFADERRLRTQTEAKRLIEWVGRGGRAIVVVPAAADEENPDPILRALGVVVHDRERLWFGYLRLVTPDVPEPLFLHWYGGTRVEAPAGSETIEADLLQPRHDEGASEIERRRVQELLDRLRRDREDEAEDEDVDASFDPEFPTPERTERALTPIARVGVGEGAVIVLTDASFLGNGQIGELDHARAAWALLSWGGKPTGVVFVNGSGDPDFFATIAAAVWPGLVALAALLGALAWRSGRRFGPAEADAPLVRRRLMEHVEASGRFHWRRGDVETLLAGARRAVAARLLRRRPHLAEQPLERRVAALAGLSGHSPAEVEHALTPGAPGGPEDFTRCVRTLEAIRRHL